MGVKHFYFWYSRQWKECVSRARPQGQGKVDILCLDMNGLFHQAAQQVFQYGTCAPPAVPAQSLLGRAIVPRASTMIWTARKRAALHRAIFDKADQLVRAVAPQKRLLLCVDGVAGLGKMNQQRQRRFRSVWDAEKQQMKEECLCVEREFHPNCFTPGTGVMNDLTRALDRFVRHKQASDPVWAALEVLVSDEKVAGEGEHKIMTFLRRHASPQDVPCIYGLDADLVMLAMLLPQRDIWILREMQEGLAEWIDIRRFQARIQAALRWPTRTDKQQADAPAFHPRTAVLDFVLLCFLVGNDFLPTMPTLAIMDGAVETVMEVYQRVGQRHGHLTMAQTTSIRPTALAAFFRELARREPALLLHKYSARHGGKFTPDPLVLRHLDARTHTIDWAAYRTAYYGAHFPPDCTPATLAKQYLDGMVWVLRYYAHGMPDWTWFFPHLYGPFASDMAAALCRYRPPQFELHRPVPAFLQLFMVLPPCHRTLLPRPYHALFDSPSLRYAFPRELRLDMAGKRKDWEAIVPLAPLKLEDVWERYRRVTPLLDAVDKRRNRPGTSFLHRGPDVHAITL